MWIKALLLWAARGKNDNSIFRHCHRQEDNFSSYCSSAVFPLSSSSLSWDVSLEMNKTLDERLSELVCAVLYTQWCTHTRKQLLQLIVCVALYFFVCFSPRFSVFCKFGVFCVSFFSCRFFRYRPTDWRVSPKLPVSYWFCVSRVNQTVNSSRL